MTRYVYETCIYLYVYTYSVALVLYVSICVCFFALFLGGVLGPFCRCVCVVSSAGCAVSLLIVANMQLAGAEVS